MNKGHLLQRDDRGDIIMNEHNILLICQQDRLYEYADLNTKLYLHFKAFKKIGGLENFINVKVLWLENNFINKIEGLDSLSSLTHVFLQNNLIDKMEGFDSNYCLHTINLSSNSIRRIENIRHLKHLSTLELEGNKIQKAFDVSEIAFNQTVCTLNLKNNYLKFEDQSTGQVDELLRVFISMENLKCLYLQDNEYVRSVQNYRKTYISSLPLLTYLDSQPVFPNERRIADAWGKEGKDGESREREKIKNEEQLKRNESRAEVRKQLPIHLQNKINLFQKQIDQLKTENEALEKRKEDLIIHGKSRLDIEFVEESIKQNNLRIDELSELLRSMRERQEKQLSQSTILLKQQEEGAIQIQRKEPIQLDELD